MAAPLGEHAQLHRRQRLELAHHALPTRPPPRAPTAPSQGVSPQPQGILHFQHLDGRVPCVRHPHVHSRRTGRGRRGPLTSANRLIVRPARPHLTSPLHVVRCTLTSESDVVHGSLVLRGNAKL